MATPNRTPSSAERKEVTPGAEFNSLTVERLVGKDSTGTLWECRCTCGRTRVVCTAELTQGRVKQCRECRRPSVKPETMKCKKCQTVKPFTEEFFRKNPHHPFGLRPRCLDCAKGTQRKDETRIRKNIRMEALVHYSGSETPFCRCCGTTVYEWLAFDHINDDGADDRHQHGPIDKLIRQWKREGWPAVVQVLCHNCNFCKSLLGHCVHHPELKPAVDHVRKGATRPTLLVPLSEMADSATACRICKRLFPLDGEHFNRRRESPSGYRTECKDCFRTKSLHVARARRRRYKEQALQHYAGDDPACSCCSERTFEFLTMDHVGGGGSKHRKEEGYGDLCEWLVRNGFPDGYDVLCANCNLAKGFHGRCPCQDKKSSQPIR